MAVVENDHVYNIATMGMFGGLNSYVFPQTVGFLVLTMVVRDFSKETINRISYMENLIHMVRG